MPVGRMRPRYFRSGAISDSSPSSGFSAAKMTRNGAPFQGAIGEASNASPGSSWHVAVGAWASG